MGRKAKTTRTEPRKRRSNGEGTVTVRSDGRIMGRYYHKGKRHTFYSNSEAEARARLAEITTEIRADAHVAPEQVKLEEWLLSWLERYVLISVKGSTYTSYKGHVRNHINPYLGTVKLQYLDIDTLQDHFNLLLLKGNKARTGEGLSPKTCKNVYNTLRLALDQAVLSKRIKFNPIYGVKLAKIEDVEHRVFTLEEQEAMFKAAYQNPEIHAFGIVFALSTGLRIGELLGLKWEDVSEMMHTFKVRRTVERMDLPEDVQKETGKKTYLSIDSPKTPKARRTISLFDELWEDLMLYSAQQRRHKESLGGAYDDQGYIFCNALGKVMEPKTYSDLWHRVRKAAGVNYASFHTTRHTFATRALENGMDVKVLSEILGHAQVSTTLNMYGEVLEEHKKTSMTKMSNTYLGRLAMTGRISLVESDADIEAGDETVGARTGSGGNCEVIYFSQRLAERAEKR